jgi:hypothetical protein
MKIDADAVAARMLTLLPADGTPILNRVMRLMLSRDLERTVTEDLYAQARAQLLQDKKIGRLRGQGGQIFLDKSEPDQPTIASDKWPEHGLMEWLSRYLQGPFQEGLDIPKEGICIVKDTSKMGPIRGKWARPDFILVSAMRFELMPGAQVDVHSFELKTETGATDLAVYEALAQTRFTHFGHLVWHLPDKSPAEARLQEISKQCDEHGVGLIRMRRPNETEEFEIVLDPVRKATSTLAVEGFLELRLSQNEREKIRRVITGAPG